MSRDERVSDERLAVACHPDEHAIAPTWSNARIDCYELALDLRDSRAREQALRSALRDLLVSADCTWEDGRSGGHDWPEAVGRARAVLDAPTGQEGGPRD